MLSVRSRDERPIDRQSQDVGTGERQPPRNLGELVVVADRDAQSADRGVEDRARILPAFEQLRFGTPEVGLAVVADPAPAGEDGRRVEQLRAGTLGVADDGDDPEWQRRREFSPSA